MLFKFLEKSSSVLTAAPVQELESKDYCAYQLGINGKNVLFRVAKITPTKVGQFVTLWKRPNKEIAPFDEKDGIDSVIVCVIEGDNQGVFIFPKEVLIKQRIFTHNGIEGKRAFRVYPQWVTVESKEALRTQKWQLHYFYSSWNVKVE